MNAVGVPGSVCWLRGNGEVNAGAELPADKSYMVGVYVLYIWEQQMHQLWPPLYSVLV